MAGDKHIPIRTCVICRVKASKYQLLRFVLDQNGDLVMDAKKIMPGRGIYICDREGCMKSLVILGDKRGSNKRKIKGCAQAAIMNSGGIPWQK